MAAFTLTGQRGVERRSAPATRGSCTLWGRAGRKRSSCPRLAIGFWLQMSPPTPSRRDFARRARSVFRSLRGRLEVSGGRSAQKAAGRDVGRIPGRAAARDVDAVPITCAAVGGIHQRGRVGEV